MNGDFVQLIDSPSHPNGRRYSDADREAAYLLWRTTAGRSQRKVAEMLGLSASTVGTWSVDGKWTKRSRREDQEAIELGRRSIASLVSEEVVRSLETIRMLRDADQTPAKTRLDAALALLGLAGLAPVKFSAASVLTESSDETRSAPTDYAAMSRDELAAAERRLDTRRE